jgi:type II secretion system protein N
MAAANEIASLNEVNYKGKSRTILIMLLGSMLFILAFANHYPIGEKVKQQIKAHLATTPCRPDFGQIRFEWLMPKIVISDLVLPARCFNRQGDPLKLTHVTLNYHFINFAPLGLPFRLDTELGGQPLALYYVLGIGKQLIRLKDQTLEISRLEPVIGGDFKIAGTLTADINLSMEQNLVRSLELKAASKNLQIPSQTVQSVNLPTLRINEFFLEVTSENYPRVKLNKLVLGDVDSPVRANFRGKMDLAEPIQMTALDISGEIGFSEEFRQGFPVDLFFGRFTQADGFYQIKIGGSVQAPLVQ